MPRRIPGAQPVFTYKFINSNYKNFVQNDKWYQKISANFTKVKFLVNV